MPRDPLILGFDTSAAHCAAAVLSGDTVLVSRAEEMGRGQAERLVPLLEEVLATQGATWDELAAIGVGGGPGNFTGIRIAVATARGLALSLGVPAIGVSGFEARALGLPRPVSAMIEAPRSMAYVQRFGDSAEPPALLPRDAAEAMAPLTPPIGAAKLAEAIARLAARRLAEGGDIPRPAPLYLRAADAAPASDPPPVILP